MKRVAFCLLIVTALASAENKDYFSFNAGNTELRMESSTEKTRVDDTQYSFTLGHYYDNSRVSARYTYVDSGDDNFDSNHQLSLAYHFILPIIEDTFSLYAGPVAGYSRIKGDGINLSGFHYGGQAGAIVGVVENIEVEAGYRFLMERGNNHGIDAEYSKTWYAGINILF